MKVILKGDILTTISGSSSNGKVYAYAKILSGDESVRVYFNTGSEFWSEKFDSLSDLDRLSPVEIDCDLSIRNGVPYFTVE